MQLWAIGLPGFSGSCKRNTVTILCFVLPIAIRWVCPGCVTSSDPQWSCQKCDQEAHLQHILISDKQNLCELEIDSSNHLDAFFCPFSLVLHQLQFCWIWYTPVTTIADIIEKYLIVSKSLKWFAVLVQSNFSFLHYLRKLWRVVKYMRLYSPRREQKLLFTFLNSYCFWWKGRVIFQ